MYKKWIFLFLLFNMLLVVVIEINYKYNKESFIRHATDFRVYSSLPDSEIKDIKTIIFTTSVTYGSIRKYAINKNILDLSTVSEVGFLGQLFMLKRYLEHNSVKNIFLFSLPKSFEQNFYNINELHIESIFTNTYEKDILSKTRNKIYNPDYFYTRINYLKFWNSTYRNFNRKKLILDIEKIKENPYIEAINKQRIKKNIKIKNTTDLIFKGIVDLCHENNIKLFIVIEPLTIEKYRSYKNSTLPDYILSHNIELIEFNNLHTFHDNDFYDGVHLKDKNKKTYAYLLDKYILDFLK